MSERRVIVIGAGPKGIALAAKASTVSKLKIADVPEILLLDPHGPAANWSGKHGYTTGNHELATPPMKDVGYPYRSTCWGNSEHDNSVNSAMLKFSWQSYLIATQGEATNPFADWVDRGSPPPQLKKWAAYLTWVAQRTENSEIVRFDYREARRINIDEKFEKWVVTVEDLTTGVTEDLHADALVISGPGRSLPVKNQGQSRGRLMDAEHVWNHIPQMKEEAVRAATLLRSAAGIPEVDHSEPEASISTYVIGDGGAASSVILSLLDSMGSACDIKIVSLAGVTYSRGESYDENRHYSDPTEWQTFDSETRKRFLRHTANGVFSLEAKKAFNQRENLETVYGEVHKVEDNGVRVRIDLKDGRTMMCDYAIIARGFDAKWWTSILGDSAQQRIQEICRGDIKMIGELIGYHLEVRNLEPSLHLPMLAGMTQGPGFPSLGCLGLLSDRILKMHC
ncbi:SidA/IucD/PvdA family monooxygenase [Streptomyces sp. NPDC059378]|uniref:SidA/IucD/PvdA family monooxygenase n=1 Tax=Streptomyces sp. NPDC059378 TaxID=3346815 RepID=UPI00368EAE66